MINKFAGRCHTCQASVPAQAGHLAGRGDDGRWKIQCTSCRAESPDASGTEDDSRYQAILRNEQEWLVSEAMRIEADRIRREQAERDEVLHQWEATLNRFVAACEASKPAPECMRILGVDPPYTLEAVQKQFRVKAMEAHPDRGGSAPEFIRIRHAYSSALQLVGANP